MDTITLKYPITLPDGRIVNEISVRRPKVRDLKTAQGREKTPEGQEVVLLSLLCTPPLTPEDLEEMDLVDYNQIQKRFQELVADK